MISYYRRCCTVALFNRLILLVTTLQVVGHLLAKGGEEKLGSQLELEPTSGDANVASLALANCVTPPLLPLLACGCFWPETAKALPAMSIRMATNRFIY